MPITITSGTDLVQAYLAAWNETDPAARKAAIDAAFTADARYVDPLADVSGADGLDALIAGVQQQFPRMEFRQLGDVDAHHDVCRFQWGLGPAGAEPIVDRLRRRCGRGRRQDHHRARFPGPRARVIHPDGPALPTGCRPAPEAGPFRAGPWRTSDASPSVCPPVGTAVSAGPSGSHRRAG